MEAVFSVAGEALTESVTWTEEDDPFAPPYQSGWPQIMGVNPNFRPAGVVLADLDRDDTLEVIAGSTDNEFRVWRYDGTLMSGWPVMSQVNMEGSPIVADFDGNPGLEAVIVDNGSPNMVYGYNLDGTVTTDFPFSRPGYCGPNSPEVGDIDRDGDLKMALTMGSGHVGVWDFPVDYSEPINGWGALFHDDWNTNQYGFVVPHEITSIENSETYVRPLSLP